MAELNFNAEEHQPEDFQPLPAGWYPCIAIESEWKDTKKRDGQYLQIVFEVTDGPAKGRRLWERLNLKNRSEVAVSIAQRTLSAICRAVGVLRPKDSAELHGRPIMVRVFQKKRPDGDIGNEIKGYRPVPGNDNGAPPPKDDRSDFQDKPAPWA